ncbi:MAG TPA: hypothetical protein GXX26_09740 [Clostridiaceae bacterium]|nr:hypothetical protein [Clostridiaceae bacterium]
MTGIVYGKAAFNADKYFFMSCSLSFTGNIKRFEDYYTIILKDINTKVIKDDARGPCGARI